jgi:hypothetical protein
LICAEGTKTPAGGRARGDPADALASRRLPGPPAESEVPRDRQKTACPCGDYSKKLSLVERKSTDKFNTAFFKARISLFQCDFSMIVTLLIYIPCTGKEKELWNRLRIIARFKKRLTHSRIRMYIFT